jgi:hypothetical protein
VAPVVEIWGFRKEKSIFWQMRAILKIVFHKKSFACFKIIFFRMQKCKNWSKKKKEKKQWNL